MAQWTLKAEYDADARVWYTVEGDVPGLAADAETLERKIGPMILDLLEIHADQIPDKDRLVPPHNVRIVAHHERAFDIAAFSLRTSPAIRAAPRRACPRSPCPSV